VPLLYGFSPAVVPPERAQPDWVEVTGCWILPAATDWAPPTALAAFLAAGPAPVVVSFGDQADRHPERTTAVLLEALRRAGQRAILVRGRHLAAGAALPPDVLVVDPLPHDWLFPRAAAVVHHGGAGTTFSALRAGVPSIVVPGFADQPVWARRVYALGAGPAPIPRRRLTAARLAPAIRSACTDPALRERAATLARSLAREDGVGTAVASFERTLDRRDRNVPSPHPQQEASCTSGSSSLV
jgi:sterol 3beta-glucosyltransferase